MSMPVTLFGRELHPVPGHRSAYVYTGEQLTMADIEAAVENEPAMEWQDENDKSCSDPDAVYVQEVQCEEEGFEDDPWCNMYRVDLKEKRIDVS